MRYKQIIIGLFLLSIHITTYTVFQVISQPGLYKLGENVTYSPAVPNDIIFQITSSDVEFDLGDRFIAQDGASVQTGLIAIQVASGLSNVVIKSSTNGSIQNIIGTGIQVLSSCSRIMIDNITVFACVDRGIDFVGGLGTEITDSQIQNCKVIQCSSDSLASAAMSLIFCNNLLVRNVILDSNGTSQAFSCIELDNSNGCNFDTITMSNNTSTLTWNGLFLNTITDCTFKNCLCENNSSVVSASGYALDSSSNVAMQNCSAIATSCSGQVVDFRLSSCTNINIDSCLVEGIVSGEGIGFFDLQSTGITFINCIARSNSGGTSMQGFATTGSSLSTFIKCLASDQTASGGFADGFGIATTASPFVQNCTATRNIGTPVGANSFGIFASGNTNQVFVHNIASRNGTVAANQFSGVAAGAVNNVLATAVNSAAIGPWTNLGIT